MMSHNYAKLIMSVWYDEITSPWLILSTYKAKNIKYTAKNMHEEKTAKKYLQQIFYYGNRACPN